jgi:site-specific recombinase XerC
MLRISWERTGDEVVDRLGGQFVERAARYARGGSYERRMEKYNRYIKFLVFLGGRFGPEDIRNIQPYHVAMFIRHLRDVGRSENTIARYIAVIRWWHDKIPLHRYNLPENAILKELEARLDDKAYREEIKNRCRVKRHGRRL